MSPDIIQCFTHHLWTTGTAPHSSEATIVSCWSSPRSQGFSGNRTPARGFGRCCKHCTLLDIVADSYSKRQITDTWELDPVPYNSSGDMLQARNQCFSPWLNISMVKCKVSFFKQNLWAHKCDRFSQRKHTSGSCWKMTTRPPLSPVASSSPEWLNSTVDMMSAVEWNEHIIKLCALFLSLLL